jgi:hypothetical protein
LSFIKTVSPAGHQWLAPVILATQEAEIRRPAWANSSGDPISKIPITKRAGGVAQGKGPEFKLQYCKKKKKKKSLLQNLLIQIFHSLASASTP